MEESLFKNIHTEEVYDVPAPVTIVLSIPWSAVKEDQRLLLTKILQAVKLSLESVRIVHQQSFDLSSWAYKPARLLAFLAPPKGLASYEVIRTGDTSMIFSDTIEMLMADDGAKRKLWAALRVLFPA